MFYLPENCYLTIVGPMYVACSPNQPVQPPQVQPPGPIEVTPPIGVIPQPITPPIGVIPQPPQVQPPGPIDVTTLPGYGHQTKPNPHETLKDAIVYYVKHKMDEEKVEELKGKAEEIIEGLKKQGMLKPAEKPDPHQPK